MLWNEIDYKVQLKVIDRIVELFSSEEDAYMQDAIMAAINELETWSNSPCQVYNHSDEYVAFGQDPIKE